MPRRPAIAMAVFLVVSFGLAWLVSLPLWLGDGIASPLLVVVAGGMMFTPAIATVAALVVEGRPPREAIRSIGVWPLRPARRLLAFLGLALVVPVALILVALPVGAALGVYPADWAGMSGFRELTAAQFAALGIDELPMPIQAFAAVQLVNVVIGAFLNLVPAFGEEVGWRGWLLPRLLPLGTVPALALSGVIWGLWHAPLILLGYNYAPAPGWLGLLAMIGMCTVVGAVFAWLRLRSASVWPPALAHGAFNAAAGLYVVFLAAGETVDLTHATILGWSGWIVPAALVAVLIATGRMRPAPQAPARARPVAATAPEESPRQDASFAG